MITFQPPICRILIEDQVITCLCSLVMRERGRDEESGEGGEGK